MRPASGALCEFPQGKTPAKNGTFAAILSTHASRSTSRRGAVLERLGPFGAACFSQGRVVDHRRALAGSQRACDASQQSACICVGSVCSGASGHFSAKWVIRFLQRRACAEGSMCRMGLSSLYRCKIRVLEICVPPLRRCQAPNLALTSQSQWSQQQRPLRVVRGGLRPPPTARVTARSFRDQTRPDSVRVGLRAPSFSLLS